MTTNPRGSEGKSLDIADHFPHVAARHRFHQVGMAAVQTKSQIRRRKPHDQSHRFLRRGGGLETILHGQRELMFFRRFQQPFQRRGGDAAVFLLVPAPGVPVNAGSSDVKGHGPDPAIRQNRYDLFMDGKGRFIGQFIQVIAGSPGRMGVAEDQPFPSGDRAELFQPVRMFQQIFDRFRIGCQKTGPGLRELGTGLGNMKIIAV